MYEGLGRRLDALVEKEMQREKVEIKEKLEREDDDEDDPWHIGDVSDSDGSSSCDDVDDTGGRGQTFDGRSRSRRGAGKWFTTARTIFTHKPLVRFKLTFGRSHLGQCTLAFSRETPIEHLNS